MFFKRSLDSILGNLTKTLEDLDAHTLHKEMAAEETAAEAERLMKEALAHRQEAHRARRVAQNISDLLGVSNEQA